MNEKKNSEFALELYKSYERLLKCFEDSIAGLQKNNRALLSENIKYRAQLTQRRQIINEYATELEKREEKIRALEAQIPEGQK